MDNEITLDDVDRAYNLFIYMRGLYLRGEVPEFVVFDAQDSYERLSRIYWGNHKL